MRSRVRSRPCKACGVQPSLSSLTSFSASSPRDPCALDWPSQRLWNILLLPRAGSLHVTSPSPRAHSLQSSGQLPVTIQVSFRCTSLDRPSLSMLRRLHHIILGSPALSWHQQQYMMISILYGIFSGECKQQDDRTLAFLISHVPSTLPGGSRRPGHWKGGEVCCEAHLGCSRVR